MMPETVSGRGFRLAISFVDLVLQSHALAAPRPGPPEQASPPAPLYGRGRLVQLPVQDLDRSIRFYPDVLTGTTEVIPGKVRLAFFQGPDGYLSRMAGDDPPNAPAADAQRQGVTEVMA